MRLFRYLLMVSVLGNLTEPVCASAQRYLTPEDAFDYQKVSASDRLQWRKRWGDESLRKEVLEALTRADRNERLASLVDAVDVAGEAWFDLRGIWVGTGDLGDRPNLRRLCLDWARFSGVDLRDTEIGESLLRGASLTNVDLSGADLHSARLDSVSFWGCRLEDTNFRLARFGGEGSLHDCVLRGARFDHASGLKGIYESEGAGVSFYGAKLRGTQVSNSRFHEVDFSRADLSRADFSRTILMGANFTDANLGGAFLHNARIGRGARFVRTIFDETFIGDLDLSAVEIRYIDWRSAGKLGEEAAADDAVNERTGVRVDTDVRRLYSQAENAYRTLGHLYDKLSYWEEARMMRFRSRETRRKLLALDPWRSRSPEWVRLSVRRWWDDYGTNVERVLWVYLGAVSMFALLFWSVDRWSKRGCFERRREKSWSEIDLSEAGRGRRPIVEASQEGVAGVCPSFGSIWLFSLESSLLFARRIVDVRELSDFFRKDIYRLEAIGKARMLVGVEALIGLLCFSSLIAHLLEWIGSG